MTVNVTQQRRYEVAVRDGARCCAKRLALHLLQEGEPAVGQPTDYCDSRLEVHHILPTRFGGTHDLDNLVLLCSVHHRQAHGVIRRGFTFLPHYLAEKAREEVAS